MPSQPTSMLTTVYRLVVMGGVLTCGTMAALRYGPEAGDLAEMIDGTAAMVVDLSETETTPDASLGEPAPFALAEAGTPAAEPFAQPATAKFDPAVSQASVAAPIERPTAATPVEPLEQARLTAPLLTAGATKADVTPWGAMYRATATVPVGAGTAGLERQFDGLGGTPEQAVAKVEREIRDAYYR